LYLSRRDATHARILNEPELEATLDRHGFEILQPEMMSVAEQIRLFAEAAAIVSPTSAGQANLLFASNETRNLEILEPRWAERKAYVVWTLAETLGQPYSYVMAETAPVHDGHGRYHMSLSPQRLDVALTQLLDDSASSRT
jgi:capsular polysaccharide biosynthesis protein